MAMNKIIYILLYVSIIPPGRSDYEMATPLQRMQMRYYGHTVRFGDSEKVSRDEMCDRKSHCQCKSTSYGFFYQCDMILYADCHRRRPRLNIHCNHTVERGDISDHIQHLSHVAAASTLKIYLHDCPPDSLSDFLYPNKIRSLVLSCKERKHFILRADQFGNLTNLEIFHIYCGFVRSLPTNLFRAMNSKLSAIIIEQTQIEQFEEGLLSNLTYLRELRLIDNSKLIFQRADLKGLHKLEMLEIDRYPSGAMEDGLFEPIANITKLFISESGCKNLPRSFKMLQKLEYIEISETSLEWIGDDMCSQSFSVNEVMIKKNPSLDIHPNCLQSYNNSEDIELSGNFISNLPNRTIVLSKLITFKFNDNACDVKTVENFILSDSLSYIEMKNSSILSISKDFLRNVPNLLRIDLSDNKLTHLEEGFFEFSVNLHYVSLRGNRLTSIPLSLLDTKPLLSEIIVSHNKISEINFKVGQNLSSLEHFDISFNDVSIIPSNPFSKMPNIKFLDASNNNISEIDKDALEVISDLESLHIDHNRMKGDFFLLSRKFEYLTNLSAESNSFSELSRLNMPLLYELNLANNLIEKLNLSIFKSCTNLGILDLSRNLIGELPKEFFSRYLKHLISLDLSFNRLKTHPDYIQYGTWMGRDRFVTVFYNLQLDLLDLSGNAMEKFELNWLGDAKSIKKVSVRRNNISELYTNCSETVPVFSLDLSHNKIASKNWPWYYDDLLKTTGKISPFGRFEYLEELNLAHNKITDIPIDFRIHNAHLKVLDLSFNKIKHLTHQELLFSSYHFDADENAKPFDFCHSLTIDLRNNLIRRISFPQFMLLRNVSGCEKHRYGHATFLIGDNPFECGCQVNSFLRVAEGDVVLTSELWRSAGIDWMLQARINAENLTCRYPQSVRGKQVMATETWMHHLLPTLGYCYLFEDEEFIDFK